MLVKVKHACIWSNKVSIISKVVEHFIADCFKYTSAYNPLEFHVLIITEYVQICLKKYFWSKCIKYMYRIRVFWRIFIKIGIFVRSGVGYFKTDINLQKNRKEIFWNNTSIMLSPIFLFRFIFNLFFMGFHRSLENNYTLVLLWLGKATV